MFKYSLLIILTALPLQGFCDRYLVTDSQNVNRDIKAIEKDGGCVNDVRTTRVNDNNVSHTIVYESGEDLEAYSELNEVCSELMAEALKELKKIMSEAQKL